MKAMKKPSLDDLEEMKPAVPKMSQPQASSSLANFKMSQSSNNQPNANPNSNPNLLAIPGLGKNPALQQRPAGFQMVIPSRAALARPRGSVFKKVDLSAAQEVP